MDRTIQAYQTELWLTDTYMFTYTWKIPFWIIALFNHAWTIPN